MIGQRSVFLKRPAVLCAAVFAVGMLSERMRFFAVFGMGLFLFLAEVLVYYKMRKEKRKPSFGDRLLFAAPLCLLFGFGVMSGERTEYNRRAARFEKSMEDGGKIWVTGTVTHMRASKTGVRFELEGAKAAPDSSEGEYRKVGTLLVYMDGFAAENGTIKDGQQVQLYGKGKGIEAAGNLGQFDAGQYYFSLGITGTLTASSVRITDFSYHRLNQAFFMAKNKLQESYLIYLGEDRAGIVSSMLLGERALLSEETKELYRRGGISHILAISGLHVSLLGMAVYRFLRRTPLGRNGAIPAACACVILYGKFVDAGTSTKRAVIMFFLLLFATALGRTYDTLSAIAVSAVLILLQSPGALYTASFQLSYAAAYGASVLTGILNKQEGVLLKGKAAWAKKGKSIVLSGMAIQLVTLPVTALHYFEYPLYGFFLNPFVVPLMTILLICALLAGIGGLFSAGLGYFFAGGVYAILWLYETLCKFVSRLPFSMLLFGKPALWQLVLYFAVLAGSVFALQSTKKRERKRRLGAVLLFLPVILLPLPCAAFEAVFLDVGQGDGIVLRERFGAVITVDGGSSDVGSVGSTRLIPYLKASGIRVIDCAVISHTDSDHISGIRELLTRMPSYSSYRAAAAGYQGEILIKSIALPLLEEPDSAYLELVKSAEEKNVKVLYLSAGDCLLPGKKFSLSCLAPKEGAVFSDKNASSMVLLASYGEFDLMLTGDIDAAGERSLLARQELKERSVEVLKAAHHGSASASSKEFITKLRPVFSVISCGKNNRYGHPHEKTLETLYGAESRVLRTDEIGCITVKVGKSRYRICYGVKEKVLYKKKSKIPLLF